MRFEPFHPDHWLDLVFPLGLDFLYEKSVDPKWRQMWYQPGLSWSAFDGPLPHAIFGMLPMRDRVFMAWAMFDREIGPRRFAAVTQFARRWGEMLLSSGVRRIEAVVKDDFLVGKRYCELLGGTQEGFCRHWDGENDFWLYARTA